MSPISIRVSDRERILLEERASAEGLSLSKYVRKVIFQSQERQYNVSSVIKILSEISTEINKFKTYEDSKQIEPIEKGFRQLWQILL